MSLQASASEGRLLILQHFCCGTTSSKQVVLSWLPASWARHACWGLPDTAASLQLLGQSSSLQTPSNIVLKLLNTTALNGDAFSSCVLQSTSACG